MSDVLVKSNSLRNKVMLLNGINVVAFDAVGLARLPNSLREAMDREIAAKPGRFWYVEETKTGVLEEVETASKQLELPLEVEIKEEVTAPVVTKVYKKHK